MIKKILIFFSFFISIPLKRYHSKALGDLEISLEGGKKVLNGPNSNYSYGRLQRVFENSFKKEGLKAADFRQVLILGFGAGSVVRVLRDQLRFSGKIVAVELDEVVIEIGRKHFPEAFEGVQVVCANALTFVKEKNGQYDLIIIDLFVDNKPLSESYSTEFLMDIGKLLAPRGKIVHNLMLKHETMELALANYRELFPTVHDHILFGTNQVIVAEN